MMKPVFDNVSGVDSPPLVSHVRLRNSPHEAFMSRG
jgi:hypothetical protein